MQISKNLVNEAMVKTFRVIIFLIISLPHCKARTDTSTLASESTDIELAIFAQNNNIEIDLPDLLRFINDIRFEFVKGNNPSNILAIIERLLEMNWASTAVDIISIILAQEGFTENFTRLNTSPTEDAKLNPLKSELARQIAANYPEAEVQAWGIEPPQLRQYRRELELFVSQVKRGTTVRSTAETEPTMIATERTQKRFAQHGGDLSRLFADPLIGPVARRSFTREFFLASETMRPTVKITSPEVAYNNFQEKMREKLFHTTARNVDDARYLRIFKKLGVTVQISTPGSPTPLSLDDIIELFESGQRLPPGKSYQIEANISFGHSSSQSILGKSQSLGTWTSKQIKRLLKNILIRSVLFDELSSDAARKAIAYFNATSGFSDNQLLFALPYSRDLLGDLARRFHWHVEFGGPSIRQYGMPVPNLLLALFFYRKHFPNLPKIPLTAPLDPAKITIELPSKDERTGRWTYRTPTPERFHLLASEISRRLEAISNANKKVEPAPSTIEILDNSFFEAINKELARQTSGPPTSSEALTFGKNPQVKDPYTFKNDSGVYQVRIPTMEDLNDLKPVSLAEGELRGPHAIRYEGPAHLLNARYLPVALPLFTVPLSVMLRDRDGNVLNRYQVLANTQTSTYFIEIPWIAGRDLIYEVSYHYQRPPASAGFLTKVDSKRWIIVRDKLAAIGEKFLSGQLTSYIESNRTDLVSGRDIERWLQAATKYSLKIPDEQPPRRAYDITHLAALIRKGRFNMKCDASACALSSIFKELNTDAEFQIRAFVTYSRLAQTYHAQVGIFRNGLQEVYDATGSYFSILNYVNLVKFYSSEIAEKGLAYLRQLKNDGDARSTPMESKTLPTDINLEYGPYAAFTQQITDLKQSFQQNTTMMKFARDGNIPANIVKKLYQILLKLDHALSEEENFEQMRANFAEFKLWYTVPKSKTEVLMALRQYAYQLEEALQNENFSRNPRLRQHTYLHLPATKASLRSYFGALNQTLGRFLDEIDKDQCRKTGFELSN